MTQLIQQQLAKSDAFLSKNFAPALAGEILERKLKG
jgi:hypothetical protein